MPIVPKDLFCYLSVGILQNTVAGIVLELMINILILQKIFRFIHQVIQIIRLKEKSILILPDIVQLPPLWTQ